MSSVWRFCRGFRGRARPPVTVPISISNATARGGVQRHSFYRVPTRQVFKLVGVRFRPVLSEKNFGKNFRKKNFRKKIFETNFRKKKSKIVFLVCWMRMKIMKKTLHFKDRHFYFENSWNKHFVYCTGRVFIARVKHGKNCWNFKIFFWLFHRFLGWDSSHHKVYPQKCSVSDFFLKIESNFCLQFCLIEDVFKFLGQNINPKPIFCCHTSIYVSKIS